MNRRYKFLIEVQKMLYNTFDELCSKYNIDGEKYPLVFVNAKEEFEVNYKYMYKLECNSAEELAVKYITDELTNGTLMYTRLYCILKDGTIIQSIIIPKNTLMEFLYYQADVEPEIVKGYLKRSLIHEFGHLLSNIKILSEENGGDVFTDDYNTQVDMWDDYLKDHNFDDLDDQGIIDYYVYYHGSLPMEKKANAMVGLDPIDIANEELFLIKKMED